MVDKLTYTVSEAAAALGVSRPTIYRLLHRQDFPSLKIGGRTLVSRAGLERWVDQQTQIEEAQR